jgi:hypothetical protein
MPARNDVPQCTADFIERVLAAIAVPGGSPVERAKPHQPHQMNVDILADGTLILQRLQHGVPVAFIAVALGDHFVARLTTQGAPFEQQHVDQIIAGHQHAHVCLQRHAHFLHRVFHLCRCLGAGTDRFLDTQPHHVEQDFVLGAIAVMQRPRKHVAGVGNLPDGGALKTVAAKQARRRRNDAFALGFGLAGTGSGCRRRGCGRGALINRAGFRHDVANRSSTGRGIVLVAWPNDE